jgi:hypothetical protein
MTTHTSPSTSTPARGFGCLPCPCCGEDATIRLDLDDLTNFSCTACENEFTLDTVRDVIDRWQRVLAWIDRAPER